MEVLRGGRFLMSEVPLYAVTFPFCKTRRQNRLSSVMDMGSYLRLIDFCITQLKAQGPSRTCNESKEEEEEEAMGMGYHVVDGFVLLLLLHFSQA